MNCPHCGAPLNMGPEDRIVVCENCRTCVTTGGGVIKEHYLLPAHYNSSEVLERLILWLKKQVGADEELPVQIQVQSSTLSFFPFWNLQVMAASSYKGVGLDARYWEPDGFNEFRHIQKVSVPVEWSFDRIFSFNYPASPEIPVQLLPYEFPTRAKKYFGQSYVRGSGGRVLNGRLLQQDVEARAKSDAYSAMTGVIMRDVKEITSRDDKIDISSVYYLHVPVWSIIYRVGGKVFSAFVDASTGRVIQATYPVSLEYRVETGAAGMGHLVAAILLGLAALGFYASALLPLAVGLGAIGVALLYRSIGRGRAGEAVR